SDRKPQPGTDQATPSCRQFQLAQPGSPASSPSCHGSITGNRATSPAAAQGPVQVVSTSSARSITLDRGRPESSNRKSPVLAGSPAMVISPSPPKLRSSAPVALLIEVSKVTPVMSSPGFSPKTSTRAPAGAPSPSKKEQRSSSTSQVTPSQAARCWPLSARQTQARPPLTGAVPSA